MSNVTVPKINFSSTTVQISTKGFDDLRKILEDIDKEILNSMRIPPSVLSLPENTHLTAEYS